MLTRVRGRSLILLCVMSVCALAQAAGDLTTTLRVSRIVVLEDGTESHQSAAAAKPGDVLEYVAEYYNSSTHVIRQLAATLPIPAGTEYVPSSALPSGALASTDGSTFAPLPLTRKAVQSNGKLVDQPIPYREYRFLRWPAQDLPAGKTLQVGARAKLSTEPKTVATPAR
jgi:uncharacterized repeat protein (TIGR01451 family)